MKKWIPFILILLMASPVWATTYYLRGDGTVTAANKANATSCAAAASAMNLTQHNAATFAAGDTITLCDSGGEFKDANLIPPTSGTLGNIITYNASGTPIINGEDVRPASDAGLIELSGRSYVTIDGITVTHSKYQGIKSYASADGQAGKVVKNCTVSYTPDGGICFYADTHYFTASVIDGNTVHHTNTRTPWGDGAMEAITIQYGDGFEINNNTVYSYYEEAIDVHTGALNGSIHNNLTYGYLGSGARPAIYVDGATNVDIYYNTVYDHHYAASPYSSALCVQIENASYPNDDIRFYYNVVSDSDICFSMQSTGTANNSNIHFLNNVCTGVDWGIVWSANMLNNLTGTNTVKNNIFMDNVVSIRDDTTGDDAIANTTISNNFFETGATADSLGTNYVQAASPLFVSATDFHILAASPCKNTGTPVGLTQDKDGIPVPVGAGVDIGAYEYFGSHVSGGSF